MRCKHLCFAWAEGFVHSAEEYFVTRIYSLVGFYNPSDVFFHEIASGNNESLQLIRSFPFPFSLDLEVFVEDFAIFTWK